MAVAQHHVSLTSLSHQFWDGRRALQALRDFSLSVPRGQFLSVIGPSGCGKSTLLRVIGGLLRPTAGQAAIEGEAPESAQKARDIGYVFQDPSLLPWRTVLGNVRLPLEVEGRRRASGASGAGDSEATADRAEALSLRGGTLEGRNGALDPEELLELVGLAEFRKYYPHQLSGGMQQRTAIARALAFDPSLMLMDEPFGSLDEITREAMRYELLRIWESQAPSASRKTVVFVTHSIAEAVALSDRVVVMTERPGTVRADIDIELPRPRTEEMERGRPFLDYVDQLRALLKEKSP